MLKAAEAEEEIIMARRMYDSTDAFAIPANAQMVAGYIDGDRYVWSQTDWNRFPNAVKVRIARRTYTNDGHVLDVEYGIPTVWPPSQAVVDWVVMRRKAGMNPTIYCNQQNDWGPIRELFRRAKVPEPQWWVARYDGIQTIPTGAVAKQYANPTTSGGHYDLSVVADYWPGVDGKREMELSAETVRKIDNIHAQLVGGGGSAPPDTYAGWPQRNDLDESTDPHTLVDYNRAQLNILKELRAEIAAIKEVINAATGAELRFTVTGNLDAIRSDQA